MAATLSRVFGAVFVLIGILGFFDNPIVGASGLFEADLAHNIVHIALGLILLLASGKSSLRAVGVIYLIVAALGFVMGEGKLLGLVHVNDADNYLHLVLAVVLLGVSRSGGSVAPSAPSSPSPMA